MMSNQEIYENARQNLSNELRTLNKLRNRGLELGLQNYADIYEKAIDETQAKIDWISSILQEGV